LRTIAARAARTMLQASTVLLHPNPQPSSPRTVRGEVRFTDCWSEASGRTRS